MPGLDCQQAGGMASVCALEATKIGEDKPAQ